MMRSCCLCGIVEGQDKEVVIYRIPNREEIRRHWVKVLTDSGYKVDFDTAVCSRHFHKSDFYYQCELGCPPKKLLKSKALPIITPNISVSNKQVEPEDEVNPLEINPLDISQEQANSSYATEDINENESYEESNPLANGFYFCPTNELDNSDQQESNEEQPALQIVKKAVFKKDKLEDDTDKETRRKLLKRCNDALMSKTGYNVRPKSRKVRYVEDITREDFTSVESFNVFKQFVRQAKTVIEKLERTVKQYKTLLDDDD